MKILLTNDDGYGAEGIKTLAEVLKTHHHEVWILAPSGNRSGASSCIIMNEQLAIKNKAQYEYTLDGTPTDCIICALKTDLFPSKPDVVLSGINKYGNLGTDILYSGTCAAAKQAVIYGIPAIALSVEPKVSDEGEFFNYKALAEFVAKNLNSLMAYCTDKNFLNINAPSNFSYAGVKFASLSKRLYNDKVNIIRKNDENLYSTCTGGMEVPFAGDDYNDCLLVRNGYIAISSVFAEPVADKSLCAKSTSQFVL